MPVERPLFIQTKGIKLHLDYERYRLAFREIASNTNERGFVATILPQRVFANHKLMLSTDVGTTNPCELIAAVGIFNSYVFDYLVRQRTSTTVSMYTFYQLPAPRPVTGSEPFDAIMRRSGHLICATSAFDDLATSINLKPPDHRTGVTDPTERAKLRAEIDAMVAHLYHLTEMEFSHILSTFPLVPETTRQAALDEFVSMRENGEAATFNPDLAQPLVVAVVNPAAVVKKSGL